MTLLAALVFQRTQEVTDALVTLLIQIVHRIGTRAERRVEAAYVNDLKRDQNSAYGIKRFTPEITAVFA